MMLLYAVAAGEADTTAATDGTRLRSRCYERVTVFSEPLTQVPERSTREVLEFGRVLHQLWSHVPVLPVRFGTVVSDVAELDQLVAERESAWSERLDAVAGRSECIVHLPLSRSAVDGSVCADSDDSDDSDTADGTDDVDRSGAGYLRRRAEEVRRHDLETAELAALLAPYASAITTLPQVRPGEARMSVLVVDELVDAAREAVGRWAANRAGATVTGPWPPFSFCEEVEA